MIVKPLASKKKEMITLANILHIHAIRHTIMPLFTDNWTLFKDFFYNHGHQEVKFTNLVLNPGLEYRFVVKLCAKHICYEPQYSDGVRILANPPTTGRIDVKHINTSSGLEQVMQNE